MAHNDFIDIIKERGFLHQMTDEAGLAALLKTPGQTAYIGFDCTAKSLHVGSLLQIMLLRWWQKCGHRPIVLLGGGTTKIGDPSGKDESRPKLDDAMITANMESLKQVFSKFIDFDADKARIVNNDDWLKDLNYIDFLSKHGRFFSVNRMLTMDSVKLRLEREQPLSFLEFNYMIFQAYDFLKLNEKYGCRIQMGGADQWGNILQGIELNRRSLVLCDMKEKGGSFTVTAKQNADTLVEATFTVQREAEHKLVELMQKYSAVNAKIAGYDHDAYGITSPLLTTSSGAKMGKTAAGAVWLNADLLKPYDYWQFWRNTEDSDVIRFLKLFTELPLAQITEYESWVGSAKINEAKIILATEATAMLHGRDDAEKAQATAAETFAGSGVSADLPELPLKHSQFPPNGWPLYHIMVQANFAASNGEAKRLIKGNGVRINDEIVSDENYKIMAQGITAAKPLKLSKGKKQHVLVKIT